MRRFIPGMLLVGILLMGGASAMPSSQAQTVRDLQPLTPTIITLNRFTPSVTFQFEAEAGSMWSITALTLSDNPDPVLYLYDADQHLLVANDNETSASRDARLEAWIAPTDGVYTLEVSRAGGDQAAGFGEVEIRLIPGYSQLLTLPAVPVRLRGGNALSLANLPPNSLPLLINLDLAFEGQQAFWLQAITPQGDSWRVLIGNYGATISPSTSSDFTVAAVPGRYRLHLSADQVEIWRDDQPFATLETEIALAWDATARLELVAATSNTGMISVRDVAITTPFYDATRLQTAQPPAPPGNRVYSYDQNAFMLMSELTALGLVEEASTMLMQVPRGWIETFNPGFSTYPINIGGDLQNFVLSFRGEIRAGQVGTACGMTFRQRDPANFATVLFSNDGNFYVLEYVEGELQTSLALTTPLLRPGTAPNHVLLIALDGQITFFVNGTRVETLDLIAQAGAMHLNIVLPDETKTLCVLDNIWLWSLDS